MRYEAKHNYLKKMGQNMDQHCLDISNETQLQCYHSISTDGLFDITDEIGPGIYIKK